MLMSLQRQVHVVLTTLHSKMNELSEQVVMLQRKNPCRKVRIHVMCTHICDRICEN